MQSSPLRPTDASCSLQNHRSEVDSPQAKGLGGRIFKTKIQQFYQRRERHISETSQHVFRTSYTRITTTQIAEKKLKTTHITRSSEIEKKISHLYFERVETQTTQTTYTTEETIDLEEQQQIQEILEDASRGMNDEEMGIFLDWVKDYPQQLFEISSTSETYFNLIAQNCARETFLPLVVDLIHKIDQLETAQIEILKNVIFSRDSSGNSPFQSLMQGDQANFIFDIMLMSISGEELNDDPNKKTQILAYAYSMQGLERMFFQPQHLSEQVLEKADTCLRTSQHTYHEGIKKNPNYQEWLSLRQESSTTLTAENATQYRENINRWKRAEELSASYAETDRENNGRFEQPRLQKMHLRLCSKEEGISSPGQLRNGVVRTSGSWTHVYCPANFLEKNMEDFFDWFNLGLEQCNEGKLNPVIFAAQVYQRCVTLHPFENGNGRVSRLLMDYVLERYHILPPIFGDEKNVLDAVFPLDVRRADHSRFVEKIIGGIEKSKRLFV